MTRQELIDYINSTCVILQVEEENLKSILDWCNETFEEERPHHPMREAEEGWLDYFDGDWAYEQVHYDSHPHRDAISFWFDKKSKATLFKLKWSEYSA